MRWNAPIPTLIPDRAVLALSRWGAPADVLLSAIDDVRAALSDIWEHGPSHPALSSFLENRRLVERGAATALLARVLSEDLREHGVLEPHFLETAILVDAGLSFLPEEYQEHHETQLPPHLLPLWRARGTLGRQLVSGLESRYPGIGQKVEAHHEWPRSGRPRGLSATLLIVCSSIDDVLRRDGEKSGDAVLNQISHDVSPTSYMQIRRILDRNVPRLFSLGENP